MPTVPPPPRDVALETRVFWERFKTPVAAAFIVLALGAIVFAGYRLYADRRAAAASASLASAKNAQQYEQIIRRYPNTDAAADAHLLLAEAQRKEGKFADANATLEAFIAKYPQHELVSTAKMAVAANLEAMGKTDEALSMYQQIASAYPNNFNAPLALISQVFILKAKNRDDDARHICETILTQYRNSFWAGEAAQQLRLLKAGSAPQQQAPGPTIPPFLARPPEPAPPPAPETAPSPKQP
jgi:tetratricopeptide (TPR) repeat protein